MTEITPSTTSIAYIASTNTVESLKQPSLDLLPGLEWKDRGIALAQEHRLRQFAIADWLLEGIELVGATATYDLAEGLFPQYARTTFTSWVTVAKHFPASIRIESAFLTFGHYQVTQGMKNNGQGVNYHMDQKEQLALALVWLRKADETKMSVGKLTESLRKEWFADNHTAKGKEKAEAWFSDAHKEWKKAEPKMSDFSKNDLISQYGLGEALKGQELPKWLGERVLKSSIEKLAKARGIEPYVLVQRATQDFINAHQEELDNLKDAEDKRRVEESAAQEARRAVVKAADDLEHARYSEVVETDRETDRLLRIEESRMGPITLHIARQLGSYEFRVLYDALCHTIKQRSVDQIRIQITTLLEMLSDFQLKAEAIACEYRPQSPEAVSAESTELQEVTA